MTTAVYEITPKDAGLHITKGNSKLGKGIYTFSTLPGNAEHLLELKDGRRLCNVPGTCGRHCETCFGHGCYAVNSARQYHTTTIPAWAANTLLLRSGNLWQAIRDFIAKKNAKYYKTHADADLQVRQFRINVSGEVENAAQFSEWNGLAKTFPEVVFAVYTKNYEALDEYMQAGGDADLQSNFVINISQWHHCADAFLAKYPGRFNVFEYDDTYVKGCELSNEDKVRLEALVHCPAVMGSGAHAKDANGNPITCDRCKRCYRQSGKTTAVYAH